jgi:hypothetical protein
VGFTGLMEAAVKPSAARRYGVDEETVIDWWEAFDHGESVRSIAQRHNQLAGVVEEVLRELGVFDDWVDRLTPATVNTSESAVRILRGAPTEPERRIMAALGRINLPDEDPSPRSSFDVIHRDQGRSTRHASALGHVTQSRRQRYLNRIPAADRAAVRAEMRAAGLATPGSIRRGGMYWH